MKEIKFKIVIPYYNSEWIIKCLQSIKIQTFHNFKVLVIDDCSSINNSQEVVNFIDNDNRFQFQRNTNRNYALENIFIGLHHLYENDDEDVAMIIDGDDWLTDENSLQLIADKYNNNNDLLLTHGSWISHPDMITDSNICNHFPENIIKNRDFRYYQWRCTQLRTFKYKLFNNINKKDLIDSNTGLFYRTTYDLALMFPMLEMAGDRIQFIPEKIYTYNTDNPLNDFKVNRKEQLDVERIIRSKKKYKKLP